MNAHWKIPLFLVLLVVAGAQAGRADETKAQDCFPLMQWRGWKAPNPEMIYIKVGNSKVYEIDLAEHNSFLRAPGMHLISHSRGSDWVCSPLDLDLQLSSFPGIPEHLFVKSLRKLNPEEIAAIAPDDRP
jgi:hypothetical protein